MLLLFSVQAANAQKNDSLIIKNKDSIVNNIPDTTVSVSPKYATLVKDDPDYNKRYSVGLTAGRVLMTNITNWAIARYIYKFDWAYISTTTWKNNLKNGWEWDTDGFGINFIGHPHTGNYYFNVARSNGYNFWQSLPFTAGGSLAWELFGENSKPSYNDIINTPLSGMFLGEVLYRISSNVLNDQTRGRERVLREILAGIINPPRALNRLTQGKMWRITPKEVYQKEPLNITLNLGAHRINNGNDFGSGSTNAIAHIQIDYGDPFENRKRRPFDVFRFRTELSYGKERKILENVTGYGILFGNIIRKDRLLAGMFQHFDYWNNNVFEIGALAYGAGLIDKLPLTDRSNIYSNIQLAVVPLAGNNTRYGPDTSSVRNYNFGGGLETKIEERINLNDWASIGFNVYYFWIHTYKGIPGNSLVGIIRPSINFKLYKNLRVGFEHHIYQNDRYWKGEKNFHATRTEQKLFLQFFFENKKRGDNYH
ncbi:MAG: DUF3943 domain-containing protein [Ferruginibacter sp.]